MSHLGQGALRYILEGEAVAREAEDALVHLVSCERCRALAGSVVDELRAARPGLRGEGPMRLVFDLIDRERQHGLESLAALAEWAEVRRMPSRHSQRERVRMAKTCHTTAFFRHLLGEIKEASSWEESEFFAALAFLTIEGMVQRRQIAQASSRDLQAEVWTAVANARRRAAEWKRAHQALTNADRLLKEGSRDPRLEAGLLSITASTLADEGQVPRALEALERCRVIYDGLCEWALLARTLVKKANILQPVEPAEGLVALDHALPLIPSEDSALRLFAEMIRVECLIGISKPGEALRVFRRSCHLLAVSPRVRTRIRGRFTSARLLEALGSRPQAERLFDEVVNGDIEHELYKDAFLDLLYLYEFHMRSGDLEKAARVCRRVLTDSALSEIAHEQLRDLWTQLLAAAQRQALGQDLLRELRRYLSVHWKHPAAKPPVVSTRA